MNLHFDSERIKSLRNQLHLTQKELANKVGVSQPAVAQWETSKGNPTGALVLETLIRLEREANEPQEKVPA